VFHRVVVKLVVVVVNMKNKTLRDSEQAWSRWIGDDDQDTDQASFV
jgi:hypothetical protein